MKKRFFLEEVVDYTFRKYDDFRKLSIIFPNRRAGLYFQKALSKKTKKTTWSPKVQTMEEFVQGFTNIKISDDVADSIFLILLDELLLLSRKLYSKCRSPNTSVGINRKSVYFPILRLETIPKLNPF